MKKYGIFALCALLLAATLAGCGSASSVASDTSAAVSSGENVLQIGLVQLAEHPSLDEIRESITNELYDSAANYNLKLEIDYQNGQNDASTINTICQQFVADGKDLIIAIATPAAQAAAAAAPAEIPVVFSAVTDPVAAGLVEHPDAPEANITGTSDAIPVDKIFKLAAELTPDAKNFGLLYCTSEDNSAAVLAQAKAYLDANGMTYEETGVASISDVQTATTTLVGKVDAIFVPIDNTIALAMPAVSEIANKAGVPVYVSADTMVRDGGLATVGINYTALGKETADMVLKILSGTPISKVPVAVLSENAVVVNSETADLLGVDVSKYNQ
ncbi:MAG: ABC transporter substrate-binding protein [Pygmaiobacter sp.]